MLNKYRILVVFTLVLLGSLPSSAQVTIGTPPFGSFAGGPDVIDLANLNVTTITLMSNIGQTESPTN